MKNNKLPLKKIGLILLAHIVFLSLYPTQPFTTHATNKIYKIATNYSNEISLNFRCLLNYTSVPMNAVVFFLFINIYIFTYLK